MNVDGLKTGAHTEGRRRLWPYGLSAMRDGISLFLADWCLVLQRHIMTVLHNLQRRLENPPRLL